MVLFEPLQEQARPVASASARCQLMALHGLRAAESGGRAPQRPAHSPWLRKASCGTSM